MAHFVCLASSKRESHDSVYCFKYIPKWFLKNSEFPLKKLLAANSHLIKLSQSRSLTLVCERRSVSSFNGPPQFAEYCFTPNRVDVALLAEFTVVRFFSSMSTIFLG